MKQVSNVKRSRRGEGTEGGAAPGGGANGREWIEGGRGDVSGAEHGEPRVDRGGAEGPGSGCGG